MSNFSYSFQEVDKNSQGWIEKHNFIDWPTDFDLFANLNSLYLFRRDSRTQTEWSMRFHSWRQGVKLLLKFPRFQLLWCSGRCLWKSLELLAMMKIFSRMCKLLAAEMLPLPRIRNPFRSLMLKTRRQQPSSHIQTNDSHCRGCNNNNNNRLFSNNHKCKVTTGYLLNQWLQKQIP